ncbi:MAG: histidinol-phosphate aminotransferase family protein [Proteobacteria bacterium]|nr:histidinol-phosphate aminotransferase family protein [Pseudomonadota bacterium]
MKNEFPFKLLRPGSPTEPAFTIAEVPHVAKLDQNESAYDIPEDVKQELIDTLAKENWNRYPQPQGYQEVKERFATVIGQPREKVIITAGGDQMILLAFLAVGGPGRRARIFEPTYPMFASYAKFTSTEMDRVILDADFNIGVQKTGEDVDLVALVSPNNPTGNGPNRDLIEKTLGNKCLVFVDEAYADYALESVMDLVDQYPNLLIARSLSKSMLAGVRLGYGVGHPDLINVLERLIFAPYNLNALQLSVAAHYDIIKPHVGVMVEKVVIERERIQKRLVELGFSVWPSRANFVLFEVLSAKEAFEHLTKMGIRVRDVSSLPGLGEHLRVTVGTKEENNLFLSAISEAERPVVSH